MRAARPSFFKRSNSDWIRVGCIKLRKILAINIGVFVAAAGKIYYVKLALVGGSTAKRFRDRVGGFKRRNDPFSSRQRSRCGECFRVSNERVFRAMTVVKPCMFRP